MGTQRFVNIFRKPETNLKLILILVIIALIIIGVLTYERLFGFKAISPGEEEILPPDAFEGILEK